MINPDLEAPAQAPNASNVVWEGTGAKMVLGMAKATADNPYENLDDSFSVASYDGSGQATMINPGDVIGLLVDLTGEGGVKVS